MQVVVAFFFPISIRSHPVIDTTPYNFLNRYTQKNRRISWPTARSLSLSYIHIHNTHRSMGELSIYCKYFYFYFVDRLLELLCKSKGTHTTPPFSKRGAVWRIVMGSILKCYTFSSLFCYSFRTALTSPMYL